MRTPAELHGLRLSLRSRGNSLQTPPDWIGWIQGSAQALVELGRMGGPEQLEG